MLVILKARKQLKNIRFFFLVPGIDNQKRLIISLLLHPLPSCLCLHFSSQTSKREQGILQSQVKQIAKMYEHWVGILTGKPKIEEPDDLEPEIAKSSSEPECFVVQVPGSSTAVPTKGDSDHFLLSFKTAIAQKKVDV